MKPMLILLALFASSAFAAPCEIQIDAKYEVEFSDVHIDGVAGVLASPKGCESAQAILVLGGSEGGIPKRFAAEMAERGLTALGLGYFAVPGTLLRPIIDRIPLEYFNTGMKVLRELAPKAKCCAIIGASKGAEAALAFTSILQKPVLGVILISGTNSAFEGFAERTTTQKSSWTAGGTEIPFTPYISPDQALLAQMFPQGFEKPPVFGPLYRASIGAENGLRGLLPIEKVQGPILFLSGVDDQMWPATEMSQAAVDRAKALGFPHSIEHVFFEGTGHLLPDGEHILGRDAYYPIQFGGTIEGSKASSPLVRAKIAEFLRQIFR
jgi:pimeloyl-ACP methyl ester carboxylesterase